MAIRKWSKNQSAQKSTPDADLKSAAEEYFQQIKLSKDDSFKPNEKSTLVEKNMATTAGALAIVQEPYLNKKVKKSAAPGKKSKTKKNTHFKIVTKTKKQKK